MTAHKHAEMIKAKADNMELVVFNKHQITGEWGVANDQYCTDFSEEMEYFLCHPKHTKECLNWLNGWEVQTLDSWNAWILFDDREGYGDWSDKHIFMDEGVVIRIKPRKEKRWIAFKWDNSYVIPRHFETKEDAEIAAVSLMIGELQYKEIEVEA